jgi:hypothetical protein
MHHISFPGSLLVQIGKSHVLAAWRVGSKHYRLNLRTRSTFVTFVSSWHDACQGDICSRHLVQTREQFWWMLAADDRAYTSTCTRSNSWELCPQTLSSDLQPEMTEICYTYCTYHPVSYHTLDSAGTGFIHIHWDFTMCWASFQSILTSPLDSWW